MIKQFEKESLDDDGNLTWSRTLVQNNIPTLTQNYIEKMNTNNGFSKDRLYQKIGSVEGVALLKAIQDGYDMLNNEQDVYKFFDRNPEFTTSDYKVTPGANKHLIIIK